MDKIIQYKQKNIPYDHFRTINLSNEQIDENLKVAEEIHLKISNLLSKYEVDFELVGISIDLNYTNVKFHVKEFNKSLNFAIDMLAKRVATEVVEDDLVENDVTSYVLIEGEKKMILFKISPKNHYAPSYQNALRFVNENKGEGLITTAFCDDMANPVKIDLAKHQLILASSTIDELKNRLAYGMLLNLACNYSPEEVRFLVVGLESSYAKQFDEMPHTLFGKTLLDPEYVFPTLQYIEKFISQRESLFESANVSDISAYNAVNKQKLFHLVIFISGLRNLNTYFEVYQATLERRILSIIKKCKKVGVTVLLTSSGLSPYFSSKIRNEASCKVTFKSYSKPHSFSAISNHGAERLIDNNDCMFVIDNQDQPTSASEERVKLGIAYEINIHEFKNACQYLKEGNNIEFDSEGYNYICEQANSGPFSKDNRLKNREETALKELVRLVMTIGPVSANELKMYFSLLKRNELPKLVAKAVEEEYFEISDDGKCSALISAQDFERIFGEKLE